MRNLFFVWGEAFRGLSRTGLAGWLAILAMATVAAFSMAVYGTHQTVEKTKAGLLERFELEAFLLPGHEAKLEEVADWVKARSTVEEVELITKDKAAERFASQYSSDLFDLLHENPLPASIIITYSGEYLNTETIDIEAELLRNHSDIEDVAFEGELLLQVESLSNKIGITLLLVVVGILLIASVLTFQSVRVALKSSRDWARAVSLIGGTRFQIRQPFIYTGSLTGLIGGLFGSGSVFLIQFFLSKGNLTPEPDPLSILFITLFTIIVGSFGAMAAIPTISVGKKVS